MGKCEDDQDDTNPDEIKTLLGLLLQEIIHKIEHSLYFTRRDSTDTLSFF